MQDLEISGMKINLTQRKVIAPVVKMDLEQIKGTIQEVECIIAHRIKKTQMALSIANQSKPTQKRCRIIQCLRQIDSVCL